MSDIIYQDLTKLSISDQDFKPDLEISTRSKVSLFDDYKIREQGGVDYLKHSEIEEQRNLIWSFVKSAGMQMLSGGSLTSISLPVGLSEPRSLLERIAVEFSYAPIYLTNASETSDPIERMKNVVAFVIAGLHKSVLNQKKPFNPILGETYQSSFFDGTKIFFEQTSHHPPVSHWDVELGGKYRLYGCGEATATVAGGNSVNCGRKGYNRIDFNDGSSLQYNQPSLVVGGLMFGTRTMEYLGDMEVCDEKNGVKCTLKFNANATRGWLGTYGVTDQFKGTITQKDKTVQVEGSWIKNLSFDGVEFWNIHKDVGYDMIPEPNPLPSDCSFRTDLRALADGDIEEAQIQKDSLEQLQRADKKLRKAHSAGNSSH